MTDLVRHTGQVHRHKAAIVRHGGREFPEGLEPEAGPDDEAALIDWYADGLEALYDVLSSSDPQSLVWTWGKDDHVAFWFRRMAQETAVHRWDAEAAVGEPQPIDTELAADGIDEMLGEFIPGEALAYAGAAGQLSLQCTDAGAGWTVNLRPGAVPSYHARTGPGNATIRGEASNILLFSWRRLGLDDVQLTGNKELAADFWRYLEGPGQ